MSESPLEVMDVPPVYASAQLAGAPVVSVVSAVVSMSPLSSLELDGSPVTQHNKADAAIWNSYRNASTSPTQTSTKIENQLNKVVDNTDLLPPLLNLGISTTQTTDSVWGSLMGVGEGELITQATWQTSTVELIMTSQGLPSGREPVPQPLLSLESPEARTVTTWDPVPGWVGYEAGTYTSEGARHGDTPVSDTGAEVPGTRRSSSDSSSAGDWQSDDDQLQAVAVEANDTRREEAQGEERRMDVDLMEIPEVPYPMMRVGTAEDLVRQNVLATPSSPLASPSFLDCLADHYDRTDSPPRRDPVPSPLSPGERSEVSQASGLDLEAQRQVANRTGTSEMDEGLTEASRPIPATPESVGASSMSGRQEVRLGLSPKVVELRPEVKVAGRSRVGRCAGPSISQSSERIFLPIETLLRDQPAAIRTTSSGRVSRPRLMLNGDGGGFSEREPAIGAKPVS